LKSWPQTNSCVPGFELMPHNKGMEVHSKSCEALLAVVLGCLAEEGASLALPGWQALDEAAAQ
jgi:hypothetical protein